MSASLPAEFKAYLRERAVVWLVVLAVVVGGLVWLAWRTAQVPESPFTYQV
ncbi:hypothetical protein [Engelhardtia mirabilis]|uniref:Uncharacterized protein n=1 Tax=Engelhardtia mirabilis TaxID=2528011 RepID=A0A518BEG7_9BACT|nr:hypothetical protein Pla133_04430 [Planctomycetes bacterium Pla133]QDU99704.1 hypothetical protein Pla86_04430 [Planctomycetes bacterium Pla86]